MQRLVTLSFMWLGVLSLMAPAQTTPAPAPAQPQSAESAKILALEKKWTDAYKLRQIDILSSLLAENFVITVEDGSTYGKSGYITHSADTSVHVDVAEQSGVKVRMHGNTAVVTGAYHEKGSSKGKAYEYHDRFTDMWMKINGKWQVIASHYSVPFNE
jgi:ketosteroid isomerase-like protein